MLGAFVMLMLSSGETLEAYALRWARSSLSALAQRAPRIVPVWREEQLIDIPAEVHFPRRGESIC
jgi:cation transport ATPase